MELNTFDTGSMVMCQDVYILYKDKSVACLDSLLLIVLSYDY